ncbi:hypothetical protein G7046_g6578 [Stylonectria norvegica]|nr:hypothetical protein G7046_g6578 [Stylonectria norvegica]
MSGLEIVGVVVGALPLLIFAVEILKDGTKAVMKSRLHLEKLSLALLFQQSMLTETIRCLLDASDSTGRFLDDTPAEALKDPKAWELLEDYLGPTNIDSFTGVLIQAECDIDKVTRSIGSLLPGYTEGSPDALLVMIEANRAADKKGITFVQKAKLLVRARDLQNAIDDLDHTTSSLQRFVNIIFTNRQPRGAQPSRQAARLAKCFRQIRGFASNLHSAMFRGWKGTCHSEHEVNLLLDDRMQTAADILKPPKKLGCVPSLAFHLVLSARSDSNPKSWHQAIVQVMAAESDDEADDALTSRLRQVTLVLPPSPVTRPEVTNVESICAAIDNATSQREDVAFVLAGYQQIGTIASTERMLKPHHQADKATLRELLSRRVRISLKSRTSLALKLSSNFLQLLQTPWLRNGVLTDAIIFLTSPAAPTNTTNGPRFDFDRPFVSVNFTADGNDVLPEEVAEPRRALLELGIILLELWYGKTFEDHFQCENTPIDHYRRNGDRVARRHVGPPTNAVLPGNVPVHNDVSSRYLIKTSSFRHLELGLVGAFGIGLALWLASRHFSRLISNIPSSRRAQTMAIGPLSPGSIATTDAEGRGDTSACDVSLTLAVQSIPQALRSWGGHTHAVSPC